MNKRMNGWMSVVALGLLACAGNLVAGDMAVTGATPAAKPADAKNEIKLTGTFFWSNKKTEIQNITITLTPKAAGEYDAVYAFKWGKQDKTWKGMFTGDPKSGAVSGTALHDDGKRTFEFTGTATNGTIACKHSETTAKRAGPTGEMTLKLAP